MPDVDLLWGADLSAGTTGDLEIVAGSALGQQRVLRRLLTNPGAYIWQPGYGAGLARFVGQPLDSVSIASVIRSQIFQESCVARTPEPSIDVSANAAGSVFVDIRYVDAATGGTQLLSFSVSE